jgi:hypothetical protein
MDAPVINPLDVAFVLLTTAAAMLWPPLALIVGAGFFALSQYLIDKRAEPKP